MTSVVVVSRDHAPLAARLLPPPHGRVVGAALLYLLYEGQGLTEARCYTDSDGSLLIEMYTFTSLTAARQWCIENEQNVFNS